MSSSRNNILFYLLLVLFLCCTLSAHADNYEDYFEEDELNEFERFEEQFEFNFKPKTTIDTFSLERVDGNALSNTAIEGALQNDQASSPFDLDKPAYEKVSENEEQDKKSELEEQERINDYERSIITPKLTEQAPSIQQEFQYDNGRTLEIQTTTVGRP